MMDGGIGSDGGVSDIEFTDRIPSPDTCDFPGCYLPAVHKTAAGTRYCQAHKPAEKVRGLGAWKSNDELLGLTFKEKRKGR